MTDTEARLAALETHIFGRSGTFWHERFRLSDGTPVGRVGAMTHIIDPRTGRAISPGFHEIRPLAIGLYEGLTGGLRTEFTMTDGRD